MINFVNGSCFLINNTVIVEPIKTTASLHVINGRQLDVSKISARECIGNRNMRLVCRTLSDDKVFVCVTNWNTGASGYWNQSVANISDIIRNTTVNTCGECAKTIEFQVVNDVQFIDIIPDTVTEN